MQEPVLTLRLRLVHRALLLVCAFGLALLGLALPALVGAWPPTGLALAASGWLLLLAGALALPAWRQRVELGPEHIAVTPGYGRRRCWQAADVALARVQHSSRWDMLGGDVLYLQSRRPGEAAIRIELSTLGAADRQVLLERLGRMTGEPLGDAGR
jgi:hypothetical protein